MQGDLLLRILYCPLSHPLRITNKHVHRGTGFVHSGLAKLAAQRLSHLLPFTPDDGDPK